MVKGKIELEYPYSEDFIAGYVHKNTEPRRIVMLRREDKTQTSTSYARYLMGVGLGRYLYSKEHVDHIDNNKLNDVIENLQILSPIENIKKSSLPRRWLKMQCPVCDIVFHKKHNQTNMGKGYKKKYCTCSRSCGGKASHMNQEILESRFNILRDYYK